MITWNCPACVNVPLTTFIFSMPGMSARFGSFNTNLIRVMQCETAAMFAFPPTNSSSCAASC